MPNRVVYSFIASDKFSAAARRIASRTEAVRRKFRKLGPTVKLASVQVKGALASMGRAVKGFMATALLPMVAAFASIAAVMKFFSLGTGFEDAIADLQSITGSAGKDLKFLSDESLRLGKQSKISAAEVATAFKLVASAKSELLKDPRALSTITEQVLLLKNAAGIELADASTIALESMNQFGAGADQANRFVNVLAAGAKVGASEVTDTGLALKNAGSVAKIAGVSFEETNAAIQVLAKAGQKGAEAGTGLRGAMLKLNKAIPFEQVGGFSNALEILRKKNLSVAQLQEIFGEEMVKSGAVLVNNVPLIRQWTKELTGTNVAQEQANVRLGTLSAKARGLGVTISNLLIKTFNRLAPQFDGMIQKMEKFFDSITPEQVSEFAKRLSTVVKGIGLVGGIAFNVFRLVSPLLTLVFKPLELLVNLLDRLVSIPGALKLLGGFGLDAVKDLVGGAGGALDVSGTTVAESTLGIDMEVTMNSPKGLVQGIKTSTSGRDAGLNVATNMREQL